MLLSTVKSISKLAVVVHFNVLLPASNQNDETSEDNNFLIIVFKPFNSYDPAETVTLTIFPFDL
jgi:hypothetical protein